MKSGDAKIDHYEATVITVAMRANKSKLAKIEKANFFVVVVLFSDESHI